MLAVGVALTLSGGCSAMLVGEGNADSPAIGTDNRSTAQLAADTALADAVEAAIGAEPMLDSAKIAVSAKSGVVSLAGTVDSYEIRDQAIKLVDAVSGVTRVSNQLQVKTKG